MRLGRVETAILDAVRAAGGLLYREEALRIAFPKLPPPGRLRVGTTRHSIPAKERLRRREVAEAALSRAIHSLEKKRVLIRDRNVRTGRTLLRSADAAAQLPEWELIALGEEDLAAFCRNQAEALIALARDARQRALSLRSARSPAPTALPRLGCTRGAAAAAGLGARG